MSLLRGVGYVARDLVCSWNPWLQGVLFHVEQEWCGLLWQTSVRGVFHVEQWRVNPKLVGKERGRLLAILSIRSAPINALLVDARRGSCLEAPDPAADIAQRVAERS